MFMDALGLVSDAQAVTVTAFSTNTIDLGGGTPKRDLGAGEEVGFAVAVDVAADFTTGNETYTLEVVQSDNANLSSPDVLNSRTLTAAQLSAGSLHWLDVPDGAVTKRYLGLQYTTGGTTPTLTATAWLTAKKLFSRLGRYYAKGYVS